MNFWVWIWKPHSLSLLLQTWTRGDFPFEKTETSSHFKYDPSPVMLFVLPLRPSETQCNVSFLSFFPKTFDFLGKPEIKRPSGPGPMWLPSEDSDFIFEWILLPLEGLLVDHLDGVERAGVVLALGQVDPWESTTEKNKTGNFNIRKELMSFPILCLRWQAATFSLGQNSIEILTCLPATWLRGY